MSYKEIGATDAWRSDWPEAPVAERQPTGLSDRWEWNVYTNGASAMERERPEPEFTSDEEHRNREAALDNTIADSFPASDPPSSIPNPNDRSLIARRLPTDDQVKPRNE